MVELASALAIATSYIASLVAQECAAGAVAATWTRIKTVFTAQAGRELAPQDTTAASFAALLERSELAQELQTILEGSSALRRAARVQEVFRGAAILWCDDHPENNEWECTILKLLGASVTPVLDNSEAIGAAKASHFDLVLSDIDRGGRPEGLSLPSRLKPVSEARVIYYVGTVDPTLPPPEGSFGITRHPEELIHLICDVLERTRF